MLARWCGGTRPWRQTLLIFTAVFLLFVLSPVHRLSDFQYALVLSQSLVERGSFALDGYFVRPPTRWPTHFRVERGRLYYYFAPGTSVLSVPFVGMLRMVGVSPVSPDGRYDRRTETLMQAVLAGALMAAFAALAFHTSRLLLPRAPSGLLVVGVALGSPVWSTLSRVLWSDTWGIVLVGWVVWLLLRMETGREEPKPVLLASLLAWSYFVRPTNSLTVIAVTAYLLLFHRAGLLRFVGSGAGWAVVFVAYSQFHFGRTLPAYYAARRWDAGSVWTSLAAVLVSPSRGLFVFVPSLLFVGYLVLRYWRFVPHRRLVSLSLAVTVVHTAMVASWGFWWGGHSYGPRLMAGLLPWLLLLAILGVRAMHDGRTAGSATSSRWRAEVAVGLALLLASVFINARGAISRATGDWNSRPIDIDVDPHRVWDWRHPQFLAGLRGCRCGDDRR